MRGTLVIIALLLLSAECRMLKRAKLGPRDKFHKIQHEGREREFLLHTPRSTSKSMPLVIRLHGGKGEMVSQVKQDDGLFNKLADEEGFLVVYPQGYENFWNDGRDKKINEAHKQNIDDVGFIKAVIEWIGERHDLNRSAIFVTGISNGGFMSYRLACELPDVKAIAPVTASLTQALFARCKPGRPVPVLIMNGTKDPLVPYAGGDITVFGRKRGKITSTDQTIDFWIANNRCNKSKAKRTEVDTADDDMKVLRFEYAGCANNSKVLLYRIEGGGHTWPGGWQYLSPMIIGRVNKDINATREIWRFFRSLI